MRRDKKERFWEIDILRGIAVIGMIIFHTIFDLNYFKIYSIDLHSVPFLIYMYINASMFIILVGISLSLSYSKSIKILSSKQIFYKNLKRGFMIFALGLIVSFGTWFYLKEGFIVFGALHCIGLSIILSFPFLRYKIPNILLGFIIVIIGFFLSPFWIEYPWLLWIGLKQTGFYTVDYFPLFPWFGVVLIGIAFGNIIYKNHVRQFPLKDYSQNYLIRFLSYLGKHSLIIYFAHQPIIVIILTLAYL